MSKICDTCSKLIKERVSCLNCDKRRYCSTICRDNNKTHLDFCSKNTMPCRKCGANGNKCCSDLCVIPGCTNLNVSTQVLLHQQDRCVEHRMCICCKKEKLPIDPDPWCSVIECKRCLLLYDNNYKNRNACYQSALAFMRAYKRKKIDRFLIRKIAAMICKTHKTTCWSYI